MRTAGPLRILRDVDGIAHVRATTRLDAYRGQGYAAAEDRSWQMELDRRRALGRLAEAVGPSGVAADAFHRRMGLAAHARASHDALTPDTQAVLAAHADGVNAWFARAADPDDDTASLPAELTVLGIEPEPWEPWHSVALFEVRHLAMGTFESKLWRSGLVHHLGPEAAARLWPATDELVVDPDGGEVRTALAVADAMAACAEDLARVGRVGGSGDDASNNLVIAPARTATGRPVLAGDPHRAIDLPNVYWQNHLTSTGTGDDALDVIGLSFPGVPGHPHFGHNAEVAWCITHGMADDQDLYVVDLRRTGGGVEARTGDGWAQATARSETITVAGHDDVAIEVVVTPRGPIVAGGPGPDDASGTGIALAWTATAELDTTFDALAAMATARSVDDLDAALTPWVVPVNNLLMADTGGTIAYRMRGRVAVRGVGDGNGWTAVPGDEADRTWTGFVADADLPRWRDPEAGFLVTSNNRILTDGPYISHDWAHPTRARRLTDRLAGETGWDVDDVATLLDDTHSAIAVRIATRVSAVAPTHPLDARAVALLDGWDGHMDTDSPAAAVVGAVRAELVGVVCHDLGLVRDRLPGVAGPSLHQTMRFVNARLATWIDDHDLVSDDALATALRLGTRRLEQAQGPDPRRWRWGAAHTAIFAHPLLALRPDLVDTLATPPAVELSGDNECVRATSTAPPSARASNGQVARYVFDVGDWDRSVWIVPHGVSGDARSPHHLDQLDDWAAGRVRPMRFGTGAVEAATIHTTELA